jgi:hypothetical protein
MGFGGRKMAAMSQASKKDNPYTAILHTTKGDIHIRLFPEYAPKAVENFMGLIKKQFFDLFNLFLTFFKPCSHTVFF